MIQLRLRNPILVFALLSGLSLPNSVRAQELARVASAPDTAARIPRIELGDTVHRRTYWLEGALVGGALAGIGLAAFAGAACSDGNVGGGIAESGPCWDNVLLGAFIGVGTGGTLGGLIGGLFSKSRGKPEESSTLE